ncbi:hypothetical protein KUTeg_001072 [Tegillarca granosa]|uniref:Uncharacterized protein n=1 Tax=Tegillarca granosa TaxID=220873 RepID=A0ABQ9G0A6_TEGGR|nr:hypothetical protein KUTeg_001072 [Tegillarca granosa]
MLNDMEDIGHKPGLYRWKRQTDSRVYSRSQKVTTDNDIHNWIKAVEDASTRATEQVFGTNHSAARGRTKGKVAALATADQLREHDAVYSEAQELLSQWIDEKVNLDNDDDDFVDENWHQRASQCDVKKEWDHLLENNYDEYGIKTTPKKIKDEDPYAFLENCDENEAVEMVLQRMLDKKVVKDDFTQDLGLDKWAERKDPRTKMELRHQQVKENREKREKELEKRRRALQAKKEATHKAKQMILKEEHEKAATLKKEEMMVRKEMVKIRKEMQEERRMIEEQKEKEAAMKNKMYEEAKLQINKETLEETRQQREQQIQKQERERILKQRLAEVEAKMQAGNLRVLHRHFSAWYNVVLERRLQMGKAKALNDWKLLLRAWNAWKTFVRSRKLDKETKQHEVSIIQTHRKNQLAESHHRHSLLRKYFVAWQQWVHNEQERQELEKAQETTRNKMFALLEAAATGKLWSDKNNAVDTTENCSGSVADTRRHASAKNRLEPSNSSEVDDFFSGSVKRPQTSHSDVSVISTERSATEPKAMKHNKIPTQAWQITKKHVNMTKSQIGNLGDGDYDNRSEHSDLKIRKRFGTQPWMNTKYVVNSFENRHAAQQKILQEQQKQLKEQQRLIEELKYGQQQVALKSQLPGGQNSSGPSASSPSSDSTLTSPPQANVNVKETVSPQQLNNVSYVQMLPGQLQQVEHNDVVKEKQTNIAMETARTDANSEAVSTARSGNSSEPMTGRTASTNVTQTTSNTKYLAMVQKMEERAAERARIKAERDEKRRKAEEEKLAQLQKEEEELKKQIEEEKRAKAAAFREKKRQEKEKSRNICLTVSIVSSGFYGNFFYIGNMTLSAWKALGPLGACLL